MGFNHMKKKLLIIPFMMMSSLLGGCQQSEGEFIPINEYLILTNDEGNGYFDIENLSTPDYECAVQNIFKKYVKNLEKADKHKYPELESESVSFSIGAEYKNYTYFKIDAYSEGLINTCCTGNRRTQETSYIIDEQEAKNLIQEVKDRYEEINDIIEEDKQEAIDGHNVDKFFEAADKLSEKTFTYTHNEYSQNGSLESYKNYTINDTDGSLTEDLKNVDYRYMPKHHSTRKDHSINYKINDNWYFQLFSSYYYVATVTYKYKNTFFDTEVQMAYDIEDRTKVDSLISKLELLIENQK